MQIFNNKKSSTLLKNISLNINNFVAMYISVQIARLPGMYSEHHLDLDVNFKIVIFQKS